eukprot:GSMAST32.ASY1.ANO1.810.1 assembled CDS
MTSVFTYKYYVAFLIIRLLFVLSPGYVHPDEFFQSPEVAARDILSIHGHLTWEFESMRPLRSVIPILLSSGVPFTFLQLVFGKHFEGNTFILLILPRIWLFILSCSFDSIIWLFCKKYGISPNSKLLLLASSWVTLVFYNRPFSNTVESHVFTVSLSILLFISSNFGTWVRFTFPKKDSMKKKTLLSRIFVIFHALIEVGVGFIFVSLICIYADTQYFKIYHSDRKRGWIITPLNAFLYNIRPSNLADHGIHPRYNHSVINMTQEKYTNVIEKIPEKVRYLLHACIFCGLLLLSIAPHQEARFLLPILIPLLLVSNSTKKRKFWLFWFAFNLTLAIFYGCIHQAGVVTSLIDLGGNISLHSSSSHKIIYAHTYMPPRHFLGINKDISTIHFYDLAGAPCTGINGIFHSVEQMWIANNIVKSNGSDSTIWLVGPKYVAECFDQSNFSLEKMNTFGPHFSGEDVYNSVQEIWNGIGLYRVDKD